MGGCHRYLWASEVTKTLTDIWVRQCSADRLVELIDDIGWCTLWRADPKKAFHVVAWHEVANGWYTGQQCIQPFRSCHRQCAQLAGLMYSSDVKTGSNITWERPLNRSVCA